MRGRRLVAWVSAGVLAVAAGVAGGSAPAAGQVEAATDLPYTCGFPSGSVPVGVRLAARLPAAAVVDRPVRATAVRLSLTVPPAAAPDLAGGGPVTGTARLDVAAVLAGIGIPAVWAFPATVLEGSAGPAPPEPAPDSSAPAAPVSGGLTLSAAGTAPPVTSALPGTLSFVAKQLTLSFETGAAKPIEVTCALTGHSGQFATVPVTASGDPSVPGPGGILAVGKPGGSSAGAQAEPGQPGSAYLIGFSNVKKLDGASLVGPGMMDMRIGYEVIISPDFSDIQIITHGRLVLPPAKSTFLTFGFMPTTAMMELTVVGVVIINTHTVKQPDNTYKTTTTAKNELSLRLYDLTVNGTPLDVGPNCRAAETLKFVLDGDPTYNVQFGGTLTGSMTIPPFTGCGATEDLDPLLTASISGPGNVLKMTQGKLCTPQEPHTCPPPIPVPKR